METIRFPASNTTLIGRTIGKYRFVEQIGRGGMGTVYKALDETLDREVAIKMLNADLLTPETVQRFRSEAVTLARLSHPRIAAIHELTREGSDLLMVMEFVAGETCEKLIKREGPLPLPQAIALLTRVLDALDHAHRAGIVHRDLKPANIMVTPSGDVKIMDFGVARVVGSEHLTSDGFLVGTPAYMAPEQVRGEEVDRRTDVYSAAVVLYRMLTGHLPFEVETPVAIIQATLNETAPAARSHRPDLPDWIDGVLARGLAKSPADRFQTADDFSAALERTSTGRTRVTRAAALDEDETIATPTPIPSRTATRIANVSTASEAAPDAPAPTGRHDTTVTLQKQHLAVAGALLVLLVIGVAVLAYAALRRPLQTMALPSLPQLTRSEPAAQAVPSPPASASAAANGDSPSAPPAATATPPTGDGVQATPPAAPAAAAPVPATPTLKPASDRSAVQAKVSGSSASSNPSGANHAQASPSASASGQGGTAGKAAQTASSENKAGLPTGAQKTPAVVPTAGAVPSTTASGDSSGSSPPSDPAAAKVTLPVGSTQSFGDVKTLLPDGTKSRDVDVLLGLEPTSLVVRSKDTGAVLKSVPYKAIGAATYVQGRQPRWKDDPSVVKIPAEMAGSGFFLKSSKHWLTLQSKGEFVILRLDDKNVGQILPSIETRIGRKIERPTGDK